ncbi:hypothetical protein GCM10010400_76050 [Streptomyces aculeolatus]|uniref:hypothetical protein n=1 Tax=Streptomyces aculeolatus TaxID=270689 RepID=UPI001CEDD0F5|nr:hypothetical protein [Streptomyces aculeolatus]
MSTPTKRRVRQPGPMPDHGTPSRYHRGCRCDSCTRAKSADVERWNYLRATGRPGRVPIEPARRHLQRLQAAGMPNKDIMRAARITAEMLCRIARGEGRILHSTQARLLAVPPPAQPGRTSRTLDGTGTRRRLQALIAIGFTRAVIAQHIPEGMTKEYIGYLLRTDGPVTTWNAGRINRAYQELADRRPEDHGVARHHARAARAQAQRQGWAPPICWDDDTIDDPAAQANYGEDTPKFVALAENALELEAQGYTRGQAAERLGETKQNVQAAISRWRRRVQSDMETAA